MFVWFRSTSSAENSANALETGAGLCSMMWSGRRCSTEGNVLEFLKHLLPMEPAESGDDS